MTVTMKLKIAVTLVLVWHRLILDHSHCLGLSDIIMSEDYFSRYVVLMGINISLQQCHCDTENLG